MIFGESAYRKLQNFCFFLHSRARYKKNKKEEEKKLFAVKKLGIS